MTKTSYVGLITPFHCNRPSGTTRFFSGIEANCLFSDPIACLAPEVYVCFLIFSPSQFRVPCSNRALRFWNMSFDLLIGGCAHLIQSRSGYGFWLSRSCCHL